MATICPSKLLSSLLLLFLFFVLATVFNHSNNSNHNLDSYLSVSAMSTSKTASCSYRGALIFLHGLGDTPRGWSNLEQSLPRLRPNLDPSNVKYVFPAAPTIPLTINGGATMPGWFDLFDWPIAVGSKDDPEGLMRSVAQIETEVERLERDHGIPPNKIVIGGFSQGGAVALLSCYHQKKAAEGKGFAGCVGLSAWLTIPEEVVREGTDKKDDPRTTIPLFWGHGTYDDKVLFEQQKFGIETLTNEFGLDYKLITQTQYPMGHESSPRETEDLAEFIDNVLFGSDDAAKADRR